MSQSPFLIHTPTQFNHVLLSQILKKGDQALDATCGNGYDTLFLANQVLSEEKGWVFALDLQKKAIEATLARLKDHLTPALIKRISLKQSCHSKLEEFEKECLEAIVYNFGYLPGSDHQITTQSKTSIESLENALGLLKPGGYLSLTCYPGHEEGKGESEDILNWVQGLNKGYICTRHSWINRRETAPFLILVQRKLKLPS